MSFELWLAFVAASTIITLIPGPSVLMVVSQALTRGLRASFLCIVGDLFAGVVLMTLSLIGVGAILAASVTLFIAVKWAGVLYMAYLGICQIIEARKARTPTSVPEKRSTNSMRAGFFTGILNPKAIIFYVAFLSQFMDPTGNTLLQFSILVATSTIVVGVLLAGYALLATRARQTFQSRKSQKIFGYTGGSFLIGGSVLMAATR